MYDTFAWAATFTTAAILSPDTTEKRRGVIVHSYDTSSGTVFVGLGQGTLPVAAVTPGDTVTIQSPRAIGSLFMWTSGSGITASGTASEV